MTNPTADSTATRLKLIDADVHNAIANNDDLLPFLSEYWGRHVKNNGLTIPGHSWTSPVGVFRTDTHTPNNGIPGSDPAHLMTDHMERHGIDYAILTGSNILGLSVHPNPDCGNALASAYNEWLSHTWLSFSPKYKGSIIVNHSDPNAAAKEIRKWGSHPDMVQVLMASGTPRLFGQRFFDPIYEAAAECDLPVAVHPGTEGRGTAGAPTASGYPTGYMEWHNILPTNYMAQINSLVCEGTFEKFPTLKFVAIEGGIAWLPHLMWRMDKNYKALRDTTPWLKKRPSEYIREHVRLTTQPIEEPENPEHILQIFEMMDAKNTVMFSSDYPHWDFDNPKMALPPIRGELKDRILWGNAAALYHLEAPAA